MIEQALCRLCGKEYTVETELVEQVRFGSVKEVEIETSDGMCEGCRQDETEE